MRFKMTKSIDGGTLLKTAEPFDVFMAKYTNALAMIEELAAMAEDHFDANPDAVNWGDVGTISDIEKHLRRAMAAATGEDTQ